MLRALRDLFDRLAPERSGANDEQSLRLATAVLLVEVVRADPGVQPGEREALLAALRQRFALDADAAEDLVARARQESLEANDFFSFTSVVNERFSHPQKVDVIEEMWRIAYADGRLDPNENHVISKVAGLLHVTHGEYIAAKLRARDDAAPSS